MIRESHGQLPNKFAQDTPLKGIRSDYLYMIKCFNDVPIDGDIFRLFGRPVY